MKTRFPNPVLNRVRRLKKSFSGLYLCDPYPNDDKVFSNWEFHEQKSINEGNILTTGKRGKVTLKENPPTVVFFPNYFGLCTLKGSKKDLSSTLPILQGTVSRQLELYFLDDYVRGDIKTKPLIVVPIYIYAGIVDREFAIIYSPKRLDDSERYLIKALKIPFVNVVGGDKVVTWRYFLIKERIFREDLSDVRDKKFKSMDDLCLVWDFERNIPIYDSIETFIILSSCVFVIPSFPAINLILCGETISKKTAWLDTFREIFGDDYAVSQWSSIKGLIVSHYGEQPQAGIIFKSSFVSMIDEFFRRFLADSRSVSNVGVPQVLRNGLSDFMNVIEHKRFPFASGKGSIDLMLKTSFIATDNTIYKKDIAKVWHDDKAVLRRFTWLLVSNDTAKRGQQMSLIDVDEALRLLHKKWKANKTFTSSSQYGRFCKYARQEIAKMQLSNEETAYINGLLHQVHDKYKSTFFVDTPVRALYLCWKFFSKHVEGLDKDFYERAFWRLVEDAKSVLEPKWQQTVE
jgi:hypothetical protein